VGSVEKTPNIITQLFDDAARKSAALRLVEAYAAKYHFFHFEVAFPEAFAGGKRKGFRHHRGQPAMGQNQVC
jgi:hypothetical protein